MGNLGNDWYDLIFPENTTRKKPTVLCYLFPNAVLQAAVCLDGNKSHRTNQIVYWAKEGECNFCPDQKRCIDSAQAIACRVTRYDGDQIEKAWSFYESALGKELMQERKTAIEGTLIQAKSFHGLRRAKFRGKEKMEIDLLATATMIDLKELLARARISSLQTRSTFKRIYQSIFHHLLGYWSNSCLWCKLRA